jgi:uncharacterized Rossmann fold enzyme
MKYEAWAPIYDRIASDFGFDPGADRRARDVLAEYVDPPDLSHIDFDGRSVAIAGGSSGLASELPLVEEADRVVAASGAARVLEQHNISPALVVTDLDGTPETAVEMAASGIHVAVHAHGDNVSTLRRWLPEFDRDAVIGTTQVEPTRQVIDVGGFTDGDRAAFLADHLGAGSLSFPGWEFDDATVSASKRRKLEWAASLLRCLEVRRSERFPVLEDRRTAAEAFPDGTLVNDSDGCSNA